MPKVGETINEETYTITDEKVLLSGIEIGTVSKRPVFETVVSGQEVGVNTVIPDGYTIEGSDVYNGDTKVGTTYMEEAGVDKLGLTQDEAKANGNTKYLFYFYIDSGADGKVDDNPIE